MIEKIINDYLTNALVRCFKTVAIVRGIDLLAIPRKNEVTVYVKIENIQKIIINKSWYLIKVHLFIIYVI